MNPKIRYLDCVCSQENVCVLGEHCLSHPCSLLPSSEKKNSLALFFPPNKKVEAAPPKPLFFDNFALLERISTPWH